MVCGMGVLFAGGLGYTESSAPEGADSDPKLVKSGTFTAQGVRLSFIGSGVEWNGVLHYEGTSRKFRVTGLGVGGIGVSLDKVSGTVYNMKKIEDFAGAYGNLRAGITIGKTIRDKHIWAENENGVRIRMKSDDEGLQLNLGGDALVITWRDD